MMMMSFFLDSMPGTGTEHGTHTRLRNVRMRVALKQRETSGREVLQPQHNIIPIILGA